MVDIWINPAAPDNSVVKRNWALTMNRPVQFTAEPYASAATGPVLQALSLVHPTGAAYFWGTRRVPTKRAMAGGDIIVFTGHKRAYLVGTVGVAFPGQALGNRLWPGPDKGEFKYVYTLMDLVPCDIPYQKLWPPLGYADNFVMQPLTFPDHDVRGKATKPPQEVLNEMFAEYIESSQAREVFVAQDLEQRLENADFEDSSDQTVELPVQQQHVSRSTRQNPGGESVVERAESALVLAYSKTVENSGRLRTRSGETDLVFTRDGLRVLVEAKVDATPMNIRLAIGQLLHYGLDPKPAFDLFYVLVGKEPQRDLRRFLHHYGVGYIYFNTDGGFTEAPAPEAQREQLRALVADNR